MIEEEVIVSYAEVLAIDVCSHASVRYVNFEEQGVESLQIREIVKGTAILKLRGRRKDAYTPTADEMYLKIVPGEQGYVVHIAWLVLKEEDGVQES